MVPRQTQADCWHPSIYEVNTTSEFRIVVIVSPTNEYLQSEVKYHLSPIASSTVSTSNSDLDSKDEYYITYHDHSHLCTHIKSLRYTGVSLLATHQHCSSIQSPRLQPSLQEEN